MNAIREHEHWQYLPWHQFLRAITKDGETPPPKTIPTERPAQTVMAYINEGRWIVDCPTGDGNALCVSAKDQLFWCSLCGNSTTRGQWLGIEFPPEKTEIERILLLRPMISNRNWRWPETVADLTQENRQRRLEV